MRRRTSAVFRSMQPVIPVGQQTEGATITVHSLVFNSDMMQETHQGRHADTHKREEYSKPKKDQLFNQYNFITISKDVSVLSGEITLCDLSLIAKRHSR
jgi:hypothetical protein